VVCDQIASALQYLHQQWLPVTGEMLAAFFQLHRLKAAGYMIVVSACAWNIKTLTGYRVLLRKGFQEEFLSPFFKIPMGSDKSKFLCLIYSAEFEITTRKNTQKVKSALPNSTVPLH
jgi:hypothetical protein